MSAREEHRADGESANVARMRAFVEQVHERGRIDLIDDFLAPDFRNRSAGVEIVHCGDGRFVEHWSVLDTPS